MWVFTHPQGPPFLMWIHIVEPGYYLKKKNSTSQTPSQNLLQGNVVPQVRNKIKDLMKKFEREQFENVVDDQEKPAPLQKLLLNEEELITRSTKRTISSEEISDHKTEVKFEFDINVMNDVNIANEDDKFSCKHEERGRQLSDPRFDIMHGGKTDNNLAVQTDCTTASNKSTSQNQNDGQASSKRLLSEPIFAQQCPTVECETKFLCRPTGSDQDLYHQ